MEPLSFWIATLGLPIAAVVANFVARWLAELPLSPQADTVLAFVVFDAIVIIQADDFGSHILFDEIRVNLTAIYVMYLFFGMFLWVISVFYVERKMLEISRQRRSRPLLSHVIPIFLSFIIPALLISASVFPFVYRG
jgi:hypothetical protein